MTSNLSDDSPPTPVTTLETVKAIRLHIVRSLAIETMISFFGVNGMCPKRRRPGVFSEREERHET